MASIFPAVAPDGSWTLPDFPRGGPAFPPWRFSSDPPAQAADVADARCRVFGDGLVWKGTVDAYHVINIPTAIVNIGIPGTDINIATLMLDGAVGQEPLIDIMRALFERDGFEVLGVCVWEHRLRKDIFGINLPDLLGYEIEVFTKPKVEAQLVARPDVQAQAIVIGGLAISAIGFVLIAFAAMITLDAFTGGRVGILDSFSNATATVTRGGGELAGGLVEPITTGLSTVLVLGVGVFVGAAFLLSRGGVETGVAREALAGGRELARETIRAPVALAGARRPAASSRTRGRS